MNVNISDEFNFSDAYRTIIYFLTTIIAYSIPRVLIKGNCSLKLYDVKCVVFPSFFVFVFFCPVQQQIPKKKGKEVICTFSYTEVPKVKTDSVRFGHFEISIQKNQTQQHQQTSAANKLLGYF